jgi:hypothetical protein
MTSTGRWPYPHDTLLTIARKVAIAYRTHLHTANPKVCEAVDDAMRGFGQLWVVPTPVLDDGLSEVTTKEAAELVGVGVATIRQWACTPHPADQARMLLPRFKMRGRERTYLTQDVIDAKATADRVPLTRRKAS